MIRCTLSEIVMRSWTRPVPLVCLVLLVSVIAAAQIKQIYAKWRKAGKI